MFPLRTVALILVASWLGGTSLGCVTLGAFNELSTELEATQLERNELQGKLEKLTIERDSLENQFIVAQESYEDERIVRSTLASNLQEVKQKATELDANLGAERIARMQAAEALATREAQIAAMQSTYDELVNDLESEVSSGQIEIERLREGLRLNVSDDVLFASGSAELDTIGHEVLTKVAGRLVRLEDFIEIKGHTDDRPISGSLAQRYPTNWELAAARAARVVRLLEKQGVPGDRLAVVSVGSNEPIAANDTRENRARNRRIEIRLVPRKESASKSPTSATSSAAAKQDG